MFYLLYVVCITIDLVITISAHAGPFADPNAAVPAFVLPPSFFSGSAFGTTVQKIIQIIGLPSILARAPVKIRVIRACVFYFCFSKHDDIPFMTFRKYLPQIKALQS